MLIKLTQSSGSIDYRLRYKATPPTFADDGPGNETIETATQITFPRTMQGRVGFTTAATTDVQDHYGFVNPGSVSLRLQLELENESGTANANFFVTV